MKKSIDVHIGEIKIAKRGETLKAILGSCVAVALIWRERKVCGLAHCLLPSSGDTNFKLGARYVDQAINSLLAMMKIKQNDYDKIEVIIVGGGTLSDFESTHNSTQIGINNFNKAQEIIKKLGMKILCSDGLGIDGRKISLDTESYIFSIERIPRISEV